MTISTTAPPTPSPVMEAGTPSPPSRRMKPAKLFRRKGRFDPQPTETVTVLLASYGTPFDKASVDEALSLSEGGPVGVISIARMYGSAYGLPNPGLLPSAKELEVQQKQVRKAVAAIERAGHEAVAQVAVSRKPAKTIARAAEARRARHIVLCVPTSARWRQVVEGDPVKEVRRRLHTAVSVTRPT